MPWPYFMRKDACTSGTIAAANTAQDIITANKARNRFLFQNTSDTDMWVNFGANAAVNTGFKVTPGSYLQLPPDFCPTGRVSVLCTVISKTYCFWVA